MTCVTRKSRLPFPEFLPFVLLLSLCLRGEPIVTTIARLIFRIPQTVQPSLVTNRHLLLKNLTFQTSSAKKKRKDFGCCHDCSTVSQTSTFKIEVKVQRMCRDISPIVRLSQFNEVKLYRLTCDKNPIALTRHVHCAPLLMTLLCTVFVWKATAIKLDVYKPLTSVHTSRTCVELCGGLELPPTLATPLLRDAARCG